MLQNYQEGYHIFSFIFFKVTEEILLIEKERDKRSKGTRSPPAQELTEGEISRLNPGIE